MSKAKTIIPWTVMIFFGFLATGLFIVLYVSLTYAPVDKENVFMDDYLAVDKHYNQIMAEQQSFRELYKMEIVLPKLSEKLVEHVKLNGVKEYHPHALTMGENRVYIYIYDAQGKPVPGAQLTGILTRPVTNTMDKQLIFEPLHDGAYVSAPVDVEHEGRWKVIVKAIVGAHTGFEQTVIYAE